MVSWEQIKIARECELAGCLVFGTLCGFGKLLEVPKPRHPTNQVRNGCGLGADRARIGRGSDADRARIGRGLSASADWVRNGCGLGAE